MAERQKAAAAEAVTTDGELSLLDQIVEQGRMGKDSESKSRGKDLVKRFVSEVLEGQMTVNRDTETMINARIAQIDHLLSLQINEIMHHEDFQRLEGSWRGFNPLPDAPQTQGGEQDRSGQRARAGHLHQASVPTDGPRWR